jgi:hypothetical protein
MICTKTNTEEEILALLEEMGKMQHSSLLRLARSFIPHLTEDDILQPNDFPQLEEHGGFRYEEGILEGIKSTEMALRVFFNDKNNSIS